MRNIIKIFILIYVLLLCSCAAVVPAVTVVSTAGSVASVYNLVEKYDDYSSSVEIASGNKSVKNPEKIDENAGFAENNSQMSVLCNEKDEIAKYLKDSGFVVKNKANNGYMYYLPDNIDNEVAIAADVKCTLKNTDEPVTFYVFINSLDFVPDAWEVEYGKVVSVQGLIKPVHVFVMALPTLMEASSSDFLLIRAYSSKRSMEINVPEENMRQLYKLAYSTSYIYKKYLP